MYRLAIFLDDYYFQEILNFPTEPERNAFAAGIEYSGNMDYTARNPKELNAYFKEMKENLDKDPKVGYHRHMFSHAQFAKSAMEKAK